MYNAMSKPARNCNHVVHTSAIASGLFQKLSAHHYAKNHKEPQQHQQDTASSQVNSRHFDLYKPQHVKTPTRNKHWHKYIRQLSHFLTLDTRVYTPLLLNKTSVEKLKKKICLGMSISEGLRE